jgi:hypothetical protein
VHAHACVAGALAEAAGAPCDAALCPKLSDASTAVFNSLPADFRASLLQVKARASPGKSPEMPPLIPSTRHPTRSLVSTGKDHLLVRDELGPLRPSFDQAACM